MRTLRRASRKLDLCAMWNERRLAASKCGVSCIGVDASVQSGWNYLVCREEWLHYGPDMGSADILSMNVHDNARLAVNPLVVIGHREADLVHKAKAFAHMARLISGSEAGLLAWRMSKTCGVSDQGTEHKLFDAPNLFTASDTEAADLVDMLDKGELKIPGSEPHRFMFPRAQ